MEIKQNTKKSYLVLDDDPDFIVLFIKMMKQIGDYNIVTAKDGMEAILKARNQIFDMIFTDYKMPKISGEDFINTLRRGHFNEGTPIVLMSSDTKKIELSKKRIENIYTLEKPITVKKLRNAIENMPSPYINKKEVFDPELINSVINTFQKTLEDLGNFKDIVKGKTNKLSWESHTSYHFFGGLIVRSEKFNGILTMALPEETFEHYIVENIDNEEIQGAEEIFETFLQVLVTKTSSVLENHEIHAHEVHSVLGIGEVEFVSSKESVIEFFTTFDSNKGPFFIQVSVW